MGHPARKKVRKNAEEIVMYANPYAYDARGWYFKDFEDFERKYDKHLPVEEYSLEWIDGPEGDRQLFEALNVNQANLEQYFDLIDDLADHEKPALYYLLRVRGMGPGEDLDDMLRMVEDEVRVMEGNSKDYVYEYIDSAGGIADAFGPDIRARYFDYERFGRDLKHDFESDDPRHDEDDDDVGYEYVEDMGGIEHLGQMGEDYFNVASLARDMELNSEIAEFDFAGTTYTTDFTG